MSKFSQCLSDGVKLWPSQLAASEQIGITRSQLSKMVTGEIVAGDKMIAKILETLPPTHRVLVAQAWLEDQIPSAVEGQIEVRVLSGAARQGYTPPAACTQAMKELLDWMAHEVARVPQIEQMLAKFRACLEGEARTGPRGD